jgi:Exoribonuclease R
MKDIVFANGCYNTAMKNPFNIEDPEFEAQAKKYKNPIPSRSALMNFLDKQKKFLKKGAIAEHIGISNYDQMAGLEARLNSMVRDGQLIVNRRGGFGVRKKLQLIQGRVNAHSDGFGFFNL